jgi:hypothetical protein
MHEERELTVMDDDSIMACLRSQVDEIFARQSFPSDATTDSAGGGKAGLVGSLVAAAAFFLFLVTVTFVLPP